MNGASRSATAVGSAVVLGFVVALWWAREPPGMGQPVFLPAPAATLAGLREGLAQAELG